MNLPLLQLIHAHADAGLAYEILINQSTEHGEAVRAFSEGRRVILPVLAGRDRRTHAAIFSFMAGVMPPMPMLGRSLL
jgi:hypothetical protein